jgi:hypothetical protein
VTAPGDPFRSEHGTPGPAARVAATQWNLPAMRLAMILALHFQALHKSENEIWDHRSGGNGHGPLAVRGQRPGLAGSVLAAGRRDGDTQADHHQAASPADQRQSPR